MSVVIDHLQTWYRDGLICIGDAAHTMSPGGGVGINLAVQDAVAAANLLYQPLSLGNRVPVNILRQIQKRRALPTRITQALQVRIQKGIIYKRANPGIPLAIRLVDRFPLLQRIPAMLVGKGIRPEHIHMPASLNQVPVQRADHN
jgi:2-polyprenyl-6-methoxyphenol hydroxylase-like FAD-dependent oxidoreductase